MRSVTVKQDLSLLRAETIRSLKLLKTYPLDAVNSVVLFLVVSTIFIIGITAVGESNQIFGVVLFPIILNLVGGPSASIRSDIEMGVFEQVYISKYSLIKVALIRSLVAGFGSVFGSLIIALIIHFFYISISIKIYHLIMMFGLFLIQGMLIGVLLAGITLRFRKTETLLNSLNILFMILLVLPLASLSEQLYYLPAAFVPLWGIVAYYQLLLSVANDAVVYINLGLTVINTCFFALFSSNFLIFI